MFHKNLLVIIFVSLISFGCNSNKEELKIGLIVGSSGKYSSLGISISNGVAIAFETINYTINGQTIKLIEKDDQQDKSINTKAINSFKKDNIKIIIGNATSSMTKVSLNILSESKDTLLFSPTASSGTFSNLDDNFIRSNSGNTKSTYKNAISFIKKNSLKNIVIVGDSNNKLYLNSYTKKFSSFLKEEQIIKDDLQYIDSNNPLDDIYQELAKKKQDLIILVSNSVDSAKIIQYLRINNIKSKIMCLGWANTDKFFQNVGKNGEGIFFLTTNEMNVQESNKDFMTNYIKKYGTEPDRFALKGFITANVIIDALKINNDPTKLKETILNKKQFDTAMGKMIFNKYGDVYNNPKDIFVVKYGKLIKFDNE